MILKEVQDSANGTQTRISHEQGKGVSTFPSQQCDYQALNVERHKISNVLYFHSEPRNIAPLTTMDRVSVFFLGTA